MLLTEAGTQCAEAEKRLTAVKAILAEWTGPDQYDIVTWSGKAEEKAGLPQHFEMLFGITEFL